MNIALFAELAWKFMVGSNCPWWKEVKHAYYVKKKFGMRVKKQ